MGDENNVDNKMVKLKLTIASGKCLNCGYERTLYFTFLGKSKFLAVK